MHSYRVLGAPSSSFTCGSVNRLYVCKPDNEDRLFSFLGLQKAIQQIAKAMAAAGKKLPFNLAEVGIDGRIGPTTTTAAKFIAAVFAGSVTPPPQVAALLDANLTAEQGIQLVAANSDTILGYFVDTYKNHPEALRDDPIVIVKEPPKFKLLPVAVPVLGFGLLAISGIVAVSIYKSKGGGDVSVLTGRR